MAPGSHGSYTHICTAILEMLLSRGVSNRRAVGSFICFTCAARARSSAAHCVVMGSHSLHTERPPCWEFVLAPFAPRAHKLGCKLVCNEFWSWVPKMITDFGTCFWIVCVSLGCALRYNGFLLWARKMVPVLVSLGCAGCCNELLLYQKRFQFG